MKKIYVFPLVCLVLGLLAIPVLSEQITALSAPQKTVSLPEAGTMERALPEKTGMDSELKVKEMVNENRFKENTLKLGVQRFGENIFKTPVSTFAPVLDVPVGPDYTLGPGDELVVDVWGMIENHYQEILDREGGIYIPKVGRIHLWGLTFEQAEKIIKQQVGKYFTNFELSVTMGRLRTIKVFVVGEVNNPGAYEISSLSTLFQALYLAGGPSTTGTMRKIQLIRNNEAVGTTDIYEFLLSGKKEQDYKLQSGDTVFVPLAGPLVCIAENVKRPAVYELKDEKNLYNLITLAGGVKVTGYGGRIQIERTSKYDKKIVFDLKDVGGLFEGNDEKNNILLQDGDSVKIFSVFDRVYNKVSLEGFVQYPGEYELKPNMKLSELLALGQLLPEAYVERAEIERTLMPSMETKIIPFSPEKLLAGDQTQNLFLQQLDKVKILSEWKKPQTIELKGEIRLPDRYTIQKGEKLSSVLKRAGGYTKEAFLKGAIFTRVSVKKSQQENINRFIKNQEETLLREISSVSTLPEEKTSGKIQLLGQQKELISLIASRTPLGRIAFRLDETENLEDSPFDLILESGDSLFIPSPPMTILVTGAVNNPGAILWTSTNINDYLEKCGGLTKNADKKNIFIVKANGMAIPQYGRTKEFQQSPGSNRSIADFLTGNSAKTAVIEQGDAIIVPEEIKGRGWDIAKEIFTMFYQVALPAAAFLK